MLFSRIIVIFTSLMLTGCFFPIIVKKQPSLEILVLDEMNNPIQGAEINFVRYSVHPMPGVAASWPTILKTDEAGRASIEKESEIQVFILAADGGYTKYDWAWCVNHSKYLPVFNIGIRESLNSNFISVVLKDKGKGGGCEWNPKYMGGEFVVKAP